MPRTIISMAALCLSRWRRTQCGEETLRGSLVDTLVLLSVVILDLVVIVIRILSIFGDSSISEQVGNGPSETSPASPAGTTLVSPNGGRE